MPNINDTTTINAIAYNYCKSQEKIQSLVDVGYSYSYARSKGMRLYDNPAVKTAIAKIEDDTRAVSGITIQSIQKEHARIAKLAESKGDLATATRNIELVGKTIGCYTDNTNIHTTDDNAPRPAEEADAIADSEQRRLALKLA